uniref:Ubiquitin-like protease family profile domain-containing protein n=1 Tax=Solanum lycopersicum TaxID=4081 RepID=A0A3Q7II08_SOLLC
MSQQETSKRTKKAKKKTFAKPGSLSFLENKKRRLLTTNKIIKEIECEKGHLLKLIGAEQSVAPQSEAKRQSVEELPFENHPVEELHVVQPVEELPLVQPVKELSLEQHGKDFPFEDQVQMNSVTPRTNDQPEEQAGDVSTPNKRGRTQMHDVHAQKERKMIILNSQNQPVGLTNDVVIELSSFLGTLARNATLCPFDILDWRSMDTKKDLWDSTKEKYIIPEAAYHWAMVTIRDAWRRHRSDLKLNYYDPYDNGAVRMAKKPCHIPECQFTELLKYWNSEKFKKMSETNAKNRKKLMNPHTAGKKSFALVRNKLEKEKETVSSKDLFVVTRTRNPSCLYKTSNEDTTSKIAEIEEIEKQISINGEYVDAFSSVMGPEHPERLRLYGAGVTKTTLKKKVGNSESTLSETTDVMQQMQERMQKMEKQMEEQKKIHAGLIDPNILAALSTPSPRESTSVQGAKQGDEIEEGDESSSEDLT